MNTMCLFTDLLAIEGFIMGLVGLFAIGAVILAGQQLRLPCMAAVLVGMLSACSTPTKGGSATLFTLRAIKDAEIPLM